MLIRWPHPYLAPEGVGEGIGDGGTGSDAPPPPVVNGAGEEGEKQFDWREAIADEKLRKSVEKYTDLTSFVKAHNALGGELKSRIRVPGEDATEEDIAKFRQALGVPNSPDDYQIELPEGFDLDEEDQQVISALKQMGFESNVGQAGMQKLMQNFVEMVSELREEHEERVERFADEGVETLQKEWGKDFDKNIQFATRAAKTYGGKEFVEFLESTVLADGGRLGDHPAIVRLLAEIGRKSNEDDLLLASTAEEKETAKQELARLMKENPPDSDQYRDPEVQKRVRELHEIVYGTEPI